MESKCECLQEAVHKPALKHKECYEVGEHVCGPCECDCHYE